MADFTINEMQEMQKQLQDKCETIGPETGKNKLLWMIGEVGEVIDIVKKNGGTKASSDAELRSHLVEEMVDMKSYEDILNKFVSQSEEILKDNLVGIYLHGSAVMGCFNPDKSDLDLIIVVNEAILDDVKREYMDMVVELNELGPSKGIEMSIVKRDVCKPFVYPTPFELHFSVAHLNWYKSNPEDYIQKMKGIDKDLAAHFTIITNRGKCLYGEPIESVFARVPKEDYMDSIHDDIADAVDDISDNTMYLVLNLARVLAYKKSKLILSKKEGGEWGLENIPKEYSKLIEDALREYMETSTPVYDIELTKEYAEYMLEEINKK